MIAAASHDDVSKAEAGKSTHSLTHFSFHLFYSLEMYLLLISPKFFFL